MVRYIYTVDVHFSDGMEMDRSKATKNGFVKHK